MKVFKSKIDTWILVALIFSIVSSLFGAFVIYVDLNKVGGIAILLLGAGLPALLLLNTKYIVTEELLHVKGGFLFWSIPLHSIESVSETRNPLSSPALSLDRLKLKYGNGQVIMVSPSDVDGFRKAIGHEKA